jgi:hypothetical protein
VLGGCTTWSLRWPRCAGGGGLADGSVARAPWRTASTSQRGVTGSDHVRPTRRNRASSSTHCTVRSALHARRTRSGERHPCASLCATAVGSRSSGAVRGRPLCRRTCAVVQERITANPVPGDCQLHGLSRLPSRPTDHERPPDMVDGDQAANAWCHDGGLRSAFRVIRDGSLRTAHAADLRERTLTNLRRPLPAALAMWELTSCAPHTTGRPSVFEAPGNSGPALAPSPGAERGCPSRPVSCIDARTRCTSVP